MRLAGQLDLVMNEEERQRLLAGIYNSVLLPTRSNIHCSLVNQTAVGTSDQAP